MFFLVEFFFHELILLIKKDKQKKMSYTCIIQIIITTSISFRALKF